MAELILRKRAAMHAGEIGLFVDSQVFEEEFASIKSGTDIEIKATQSRSLPQMRMAWALARKIADSGALGDADQRDVMDYLLLKARHVRYVTNQHRDGVETIPVVKSIRFAAMDQTAFQRLMNRMIHIVVTEILDGVPEGDLRNEIEKMAGVTTPEPDQKPAPRPRKRSAPVAPISVIPDDKNPDPTSPPPAEGNAAAPPKATTKGATPNENPGTPAPPPPSAPDHTAVQAAPKDAREWASYAMAWLADMEADRAKSDQDVMIRWNGERDLRNACGITSDERQPVFDVYSATLERMRARNH